MSPTRRLLARVLAHPDGVPYPLPMLWFLLTALTLAGYPGADATGRVGPGSPHYDLEVVYHESRYEEGLAEVERQLAESPDDAVLLNMRFRFLYELGERGFADGSTKRERIAYYEDMIASLDHGLAVHPDDPHLHFSRSIATGRLGTTKGVLASLFLAKQLEDDLLFAVGQGYTYKSLGGEEDLPCHAHMALGMFYRLVPDWWIVQAIAGTRGDLDESLRQLELAEAASPGQIQVNKELGVTQICMGQRRKDPALVTRGLATLQHAKTLPLRMGSDDIDLVHIDLLLEDWTQACEYSRDGYQDMDRDQLER